MKLGSPPRRLLAIACLGLAVALLAAGASLFGFIVGASDHPLHAAAARWHHAAERTPGLGRLVTWLEARPPPPARPPGLWAGRREDAGAAGLDAAQLEAMQRLAAIGYLEAYEAPSGEAGVTVHDRSRAWPGLNLAISGHAPEARLLDMEGRELHRWSLSFEQAFPGRVTRVDPTGKAYWRRVHLYENGDLLAIYEGLGLVKLDRRSKRLWAKECGCHHDLEVDGDGTIFVLSREPAVDPRVHEYEPVLVDSLEVLDPGGRTLRSISLLDALLGSPYASLLHAGPPSGDVFHTNTVEKLDGSLAARIPAFRAGNFLLSMREIDGIAVLDPERETIAWALSGQWHRQHQPTVVDGGRLLLLDNRGHQGRSKVIEFDPASQEVAWAYLGDATNGFSTRTGGSVQRLPNGNTLVSESDSGRAFEVTPTGERVWEYNNPARAGEEDAWVATLPEVVRIPEAFTASWLSPTAE